MRYAKIRSTDIANGPGVRVSIFVQGCTHHCPNCFNKETWDFNGGHIFNRRVQMQFLDLANRPEVVGFSILGGEPLQQGLLRPHTKITRSTDCANSTNRCSRPATCPQIVSTASTCSGSAARLRITSKMCSKSARLCVVCDRK